MSEIREVDNRRPPFPIIQIVDGNDVDDTLYKLPIGLDRLHLNINGNPTAEKPRIDTHILCWAMSGVRPDFADEQEFWYVVLEQDQVTCQKCLEWLHA